MADNIQKLYDKKAKEFERLLQDVLLAAQAKVSELRRSGIADDELANFSRVVAELQENPDKKQRALAVARFVAEAASIMKESVKNLPAIQHAIDSTEGKEREDVLEIAFLTVSNLMEHVGFYESALRDMRQALAATIDSPLKKLVEQASVDLGRIKDFYSTLAKEVSLDSLQETVSDKFDKAKQEHLKEISRLEELFKKSVSNKERNRIRAKIDKLSTILKTLPHPIRSLKHTWLGTRSIQACCTSLCCQAWTTAGSRRGAGHGRGHRDRPRRPRQRVRPRAVE